MKLSHLFISLPVALSTMVAGIQSAAAIDAAAYIQYITTQEQFSALTPEQKKEAALNYKVENIYYISTTNKPVLTPYYVTRPSEYSAAKSTETFSYDPYSLLRKSKNTDGRRYPAYGTVAPGCNNHTPVNYYSTSGIKSEAVYTHTLKPITHNEPVGVTFYNNFNSYPSYTTRW